MKSGVALAKGKVADLGRPPHLVPKEPGVYLSPLAGLCLGRTGALWAKVRGPESVKGGIKPWSWSWLVSRGAWGGTWRWPDQ